jgi:hypothetical protein
MKDFYFLRVGEIQGLKCRTGLSRVDAPGERVWMEMTRFAAYVVRTPNSVLESRPLANLKNDRDCG